MPKLILKSPYIKCGGSDGSSVSGYLRYIGTRDGVELVPDDRPTTKRQEQLIRALVRDFPDSKELLEYADWEASHTKAHASAFISTALECNWEQANRSDVYLKYIATRPRVERLECAWEGGSLRAGYRLAKEYLSGENVTKDVERGLEYLTTCAGEGHPGAQCLLGKLYLVGQEIPQDMEQAEYWLSQAVAQGNEYAGLLLERMEEPPMAGAALVVIRLLHSMSRVFQDNSLPKHSPAGMRTDRKLLQKIREKKIAMGHKPDDHLDEGMVMY